MHYGQRESRLGVNVMLRETLYPFLLINASSLILPALFRIIYTLLSEQYSLSEG